MSGEIGKKIQFTTRVGWDATDADKVRIEEARKAYQDAVRRCGDLLVDMAAGTPMSALPAEWRADIIEAVNAVNDAECKFMGTLSGQA